MSKKLKAGWFYVTGNHAEKEKVVTRRVLDAKFRRRRKQPAAGPAAYQKHREQLFPNTVTSKQDRRGGGKRRTLPVR